MYIISNGNQLILRTYAYAVQSLPLEVYEEFFKASENDESVYVAALHEFEAMRETGTPFFCRYLFNILFGELFSLQYVISLPGPLPSKSTYTAIIRAAQRFDDKLSLEQLLAYYNADGFRDTPEIAEIKSALMARESQVYDPFSFYALSLSLVACIFIFEWNGSSTTSLYCNRNRHSNTSKLRASILLRTN